MFKKLKLSTIIIFLQFIVIGTLLFIIFQIRESLDNNLKNTVIDSISETQDETTDRLNTIMEVDAVLVWWDQDNGFRSIVENKQYLSSISPFWFELTTTGNIDPFSGADNEEIFKFLKEQDIKVTPIISNEFRREPLASIIRDDQRRNQHIQKIVQLASKYDGISINYENLDRNDKDLFTNFIKSLSEELHNQDLSLSIHLHAKTDEPGTWNGPQSQDWQALSQYCDKLKIMAYDYHWSSSKPGAIAPIDWVEKVVKHAAEMIPKEKIYLGIPLYGYDWVAKNGEGLTYAQAIELSEFYSKDILFDTKTEAPYFSYTDSDNKRHTVWFENFSSFKFKVDIATEYEIGGIDFFRLGGEDSRIWKTIPGSY